MSKYTNKSHLYESPEQKQYRKVTVFTQIMMMDNQNTQFMHLKHEAQNKHNINANVNIIANANIIVIFIVMMLDVNKPFNLNLNHTGIVF